MKVIKRDGRAVEYEKNKIEIAIEKANNEVRESDKATKEEIKSIIGYIEDLGKKRMLVEDIQDIIEQKLMEIGKYNLAKKYIVYRYTRALIRRKNTTDESILSLIKNANKGIMQENSIKDVLIASTQRDLIAGEVSKDLTKRMLLPEKIAKAHEDGILYFHATSYFLQPIHNWSLINIGDMLDNGIVLNGVLIETPKSFCVACTVLTQIILDIASSQYGGQSIDVRHLGKYLRKSREKFKKQILEINKSGLIPHDEIEKLIETRLHEELKTAIQTIMYQLNTLITANGKSPNVTFLLNITENDEYAKENAMIFEEILKQILSGIKRANSNYEALSLPKLIYVLNESNNLKGGKYDYLTELALEGTYIDFISAKKVKEHYDGNVFCPMECGNFISPWKDENGKYKFEGRFNQGVVCINLPQIGIIAGKDEELFWKLLDERLELCKEALMCKHYALLGTISDVSPILWRYGGIARLNKGEKIDKLLKDGYSTIALGFVGVYEATKAVKGVSLTTSDGKDFALRVIKFINEKVSRWKKETGLGFTIYGEAPDNVCYSFASIDKVKFGNIPDITDKEHYTNSYHISDNESMETFSKIKFESSFQKLLPNGVIACIEIADKDIREVIRYIYDNIEYGRIKK